MIGYRIKGFVINTLLAVLQFVPDGYFRKLHRKLYLKQLSRIDGPACAAEKWRDRGVIIGKNCRIYSNEMAMGPEPYLIEIGDDVIISGNVVFVTHDGGLNIFRKEFTNIVGNFGKIKIGSNCFIGGGAILLPNIEIGNCCIVCAGAVVAESFPEDSVIMGNPAKIIFKTSLYEKLKVGDKHTVTNNKCSYPESDFMPMEERKKLILDAINDIPIRKPRKGRSV